MKTGTNNPTIVLIDGNSLAYRAFYALPDTMRSTSGITTNAIYGFTTMLLKILEDKPDYLAISFDRPEPTFRHKEYKDYKATREKAPPTLHQQMPYIKELVEAFDIPVFELAGYEADDIIGTLAKEGENKGLEVIIVSGDLDPLQLVDKKIKVLSLRKGITDTVLYGEKEVEERFSLKPGQLIDYKALKGDASDNIPGVPKVGEKTALELLKEFGTLENIYRNLDKVQKPSLRENLKNNLPLAELSKRLGTIVTDAPIQIDFGKCKRQETDWKKIVPVFEKFDFNRLVKKYSQGIKEYQAESIIGRKREELSKSDFNCVLTEKDLFSLVKELEKTEAFAFDLETDGLDPFTSNIIGISLSIGTKSAFYIPIKHQSKQVQLPLKFVLENLSTFFASNKLKVGHNLKFDIKYLKLAGLEINGPFFDTMVAAYLLDPISGKYSLKILAKQFLGRDMLKLVELIGEETERENFSEVPIDLASDYACSDAESTFCLYEIFSLALKAQKLEKLFNEVEMPLVDVLTEMELAGVAVDLPLLSKMAKEIAAELKELEKQIYIISGGVFNLNSPKQLSQVLFEKLKLPVIKRTKSGPSTDAEVLEELASQKFEIAEKLLGYRQLNKLKSTYVDVLPTLINPKTGRIHTSFNQTITATGRLSSSDPNLQNIPVRGKWGKQSRSAFIPGKKDWVILAADYSQIELRILAHMSKDAQLLKAFSEEKDIHRATAAEVFGVPENAVTDEMRSAAKAVNFGIIYGMSDFGLAKQLGIKRTEAAQYIEKYFEKHKGVKAFIDRTIEETRKNSFVATLLGRKRPMPDINSPHAGFRSMAERMAINTPIQGTAADMIKIAMVRICQKMKKEKLKSLLILQVHDELVLECPPDEVEHLKTIVKEEMANALALDVPIKVDIGIGSNWAEAK